MRRESQQTKDPSIRHLIFEEKNSHSLPTDDEEICSQIYSPANSGSQKEESEICLVSPPSILKRWVSIQTPSPLENITNTHKDRDTLVFKMHGIKPMRKLESPSKKTKKDSLLILSPDEKKHLHTMSIGNNVKSLLQPLYVAEELSKEQFRNIATKVTSKVVSNFSVSDYNKSLTLTPNRKRKIRHLLRDELMQLPNSV